MDDERNIEQVEFELADMQDLLTYASSPEEIADITKKIGMLTKELNGLKKAAGITDELDIELSLPKNDVGFIPKPQGASSSKKGVFTQIDKPLGGIDRVKVINEGRRVFTPEFNQAMLRVTDVGGPMPK